jgi:hypothetical protein
MQPAGRSLSRPQQTRARTGTGGAARQPVVRAANELAPQSDQASEERSGHAQ